ncbi:MAG: hypothetical protein HKP25_15725 [Marinicaulis sp.]|nr:hypothetical protein [Marinicaulis sp.]
MKRILLIVTGVFLLAIPAATHAKEPTMNLKKITPVLLADDVQAIIDFWAEFGLSAPMTVPDDDGVMFAIVTNGAVELMYQTKKSARADNADAVKGIDRAMIYIEVNSFDDIIDAAKRYEVVKPEHMTDYGAREIYIRDPAGNVVGFAEQGAAGE